MDNQIGSKWKLKKRIGGGSFGEVHLAEHVITKEEFAIKIEKNSTKQLLTEFQLYRTLAGAPGIPLVKWFGTEDNNNFLVLELLGSSLSSLFEKCKRHFSLKTVLMLADQMITRVQYMHSKGFLHRDIKPDNFLIGKGGNANTVFLIDYGLSQPYCDIRTHQHIPFSDKKVFAGTARYASIATHKGMEQSRRDDLEAIAYILISFLKGSLPWQGISGDNPKEKRIEIGKKKMEISISDLCSGIPSQFATFLSSVRSLEFEEIPDYSYYKSLFKELFISEGYEYDYHFDWVSGNEESLSNTPDLLLRPPPKILNSNIDFKHIHLMKINKNLISTKISKSEIKVKLENKAKSQKNHFISPNITNNNSKNTYIHSKKTDQRKILSQLSKPAYSSKTLRNNPIQIF